MRVIKIHILFWLCYFCFVYLSDSILDSTTKLSSELLIYTTHNVYLFYSILYTLQKFSFRTKGDILKSISRGLLFISGFFSIKYFVSYYILPKFYNPEYANLKISEWVTVATLWVVNYFFIASAYFYFDSSIKKQKDLKKISEEKLLHENRNLELENALLRAQINPHFLYNALNFLYAKSLPLSDTLSDAVLKLSDIMRYSLKPLKSDGLVPLTDEIIYIENVISLAQLRFQNKLAIVFQTEGAFTEISIPPLIFITLVENLLKHGALDNHETPAVIRIGMDEKALIFSTHNRKRTGPKEASTSIGLQNTIQRLKTTFGDDCNIAISDDSEAFSIEIRITV